MRELQLKSRIEHLRLKQTSPDHDPKRVLEEADKKVKADALMQFGKTLLKVKKFEDGKREQ